MTASPKQHRVRDPAYLASFEGKKCECCGIQDGTVVGAHMSLGSLARGLKAGDDLAVGLCVSDHHAADHGPMDDRLHIWKTVLINRIYAADKITLTKLLQAALPVAYEERKNEQS